MLARLHAVHAGLRQRVRRTAARVGRRVSAAILNELARVHERDEPREPPPGHATRSEVDGQSRPQ